MNKKFLIFAILTLAIVCGCVGTTIYIHHKDALQTKDPISLAHPYGIDGRNIKHAGQMADAMSTSITDHIKEMADQCDKLHIDRAERTRLIYETLHAGQAAEKQVAASNYTIPFEPHYPPLPH